MNAFYNEIKAWNAFKLNQKRENMTKEKENKDINSTYPDNLLIKVMENEIQKLDFKIKILLSEIKINELIEEDNSLLYGLLEHYTVRRNKINSKLIELYDEIGF